MGDYTEKDNRVIGAIGFHIESEYDSVSDVSYTLSRTFWNHGIVSEALKQFLSMHLWTSGLTGSKLFTLLKIQLPVR